MQDVPFREDIVEACRSKDLVAAHLVQVTSQEFLTTMLLLEPTSVGSDLKCSL